MSLSVNVNEKANLIWAIADKLTGAYKPHEYGKVILPLTVIRRFDCILANSKQAVLDKHNSMPADMPMRDNFLKKASGYEFYNTSKYTFETLLDDANNIEINFNDYINGFSDNVRQIIDKFEFKNEITKLADKNLLFIVIQEFTTPKADLHPDKISNLEMGYIFEEIIRKFSEAHNEDAGQHYTPREVIELMVNILFTNDNAILAGNVAKTIYDPACGTGGMLSVAEDYLKKLNSSATLLPFGQEINDETFAICKADMLIKGNDADKIRCGNTLSEDEFKNEKFDYILSNPPFGREWKKEKKAVEDEAKLGAGGRFGFGLPGQKDSQMLFLLTAIHKMKDISQGGGKIAIIQDGSPLYTGEAESGTSEIRRYIFENDLLDAIIALPTNIFYNTGLGTFIWILTNKKENRRKGYVQLIDARKLYTKRVTALGEKRNDISKNDIDYITQVYANFKDNEISKICRNEEFGYYRMPLEYPLYDENGNLCKDSKGKSVADVDKRDYERIPITEDIDTYFEREIAPFSKDCWLDKKKIKIGYEIPFTRIFHTFVPPQKSAELKSKLSELEEKRNKIVQKISNNISNNFNLNNTLSDLLKNFSIPITDKLKNSGSEWIGSVPESWIIENIGQHYYNRSEKVSDSEYEALSVTKKGVMQQLESVVKTSDNDNRKLVKKGDFVINSRSDRKQSSGLSDTDGSVSLINIVLGQNSNKEILPEYTRYLLKNYGFAEEFFRWGSGIASDVWTTKWDLMKKISIPIPTIDEQKVIIEMLNLLEEYVNIEDEINDVLHKYRESLIYECITGKMIVN